ncbi:MAG: hypothetical protein AB4911_10835 [Oscillochloridaceae bacterium umkhey_bin13]
MHIVVASANIFRRELSSYILSEAGYTLSEASSIASLMTNLRSHNVALLVLDTQLERDPGLLIGAVRRLSVAPILWLGDHGLLRPLISADSQPSAALGWPYRADELTQQAAALLGRSAALVSYPHETPLPQRLAP